MFDNITMAILKPLIEQGVLGIVCVILLVFIVVLWRQSSKKDESERIARDARINDLKEMVGKYEEILETNTLVLDKLKTHLLNGRNNGQN